MVAVEGVLMLQDALKAHGLCGRLVGTDARLVSAAVV